MLLAARRLRQNLSTDVGVEGPYQWGTVASITAGSSGVPATLGIYLDSASSVSGAVITTGIPFLLGYYPTVGDVVLIARMSGAARTQRVVLGTMETLLNGIDSAGEGFFSSILLNGFLTLATTQSVAKTISFPVIREAETLAVQPQTVFPDLSAISRTISSLTPGVMLGLGGSVTLTPQVTGRVNIRFAWNISNNTSGDTTWTQVRWGTGTAPSFGGGIVGSTAPITRITGFTLGTYTYVGSIEWEVTGLTLGTAYWFDLQGWVNGGSGTWNMITGKVQEY